jgi:uncharacterized DUF497 family protein
MNEDEHHVHTSGHTLVLSDISGFDWDQGNRVKCGKHGVPLPEIEAAFRGPFSVFPDIAHSTVETRHFDIGRISDGRHIFAAFAIRERNGEPRIRPISARFMHREEVLHYEAEIAKDKV